MCLSDRRRVARGGGGVPPKSPAQKKRKRKERREKEEDVGRKRSRLRTSLKFRQGLRVENGTTHRSSSFSNKLMKRQSFHASRRRGRGGGRGGGGGLISERIKSRERYSVSSSFS